MTQSIDADTRAKASNPPVSESVTEERKPHEPGAHLLVGLRLFTAVFLAAGIALGVADLAGHGGVHLIIPSATCFMLAGMGAVVLIAQSVMAEFHASFHATLADRQEFYRRGMLAGWQQSWRGQPPELDDPLLR